MGLLFIAITAVGLEDQKMLTQRQMEILERRGLDVETLVRYGVDGCDRGPEWIRIPYVYDGEIVNWKYRTIEGEKKFSQEAGAKKCFWNHDVLIDKSLDNQPLIICEGELDALSAIQCGFSRTVSVPDGAPAQEIGGGETVKYTFLDNAHGLRDVQAIIIAADGDGPGNNLMNDLAHRLGRVRCKWLKYPKGCKDLNDALRSFGHKGVVETINRGRWIKVPGVSRMSDLPPLKEQPVYSTGIPGLDPHFKLRPGDLSVVVAIPGCGKTAFINAISAHMAINHGWVIGTASFEQRPQIDFRRNLRTLHSGKLAITLNENETALADRWIDDHFAIMVPDFEDEVNLEWMLERSLAAIIQYGARMISVDPVNEMDHIRPEGMSETDYIGYMLKAWKRLAFNRQVHVMLAVHPAKLQRNKDGKYPTPTLYDCAGSAHYYNKTDVGIIIDREKKSDKTLIRIAKSKYHDVIGIPGDVFVKFNMATGRYEQMSREGSTSWHECDGDD